MRRQALYLIFFIFFYLNTAANSTSDIYLNNSTILINLFLISFIRITFSLLMVMGKEKAIIKKYQLLFVPVIILLLIGVSFTLSSLQSSSEVQYHAGAWPLMLLLMIIIGYDEELFFRMLPWQLASSHKKTAVFLANILFALAHASAGIGAIINATFLGIILSIVYIKYKNIHLNALSHGLYNFLVLALI